MISTIGCILIGIVLGAVGIMIWACLVIDKDYTDDFMKEYRAEDEEDEDD